MPTPPRLSADALAARAEQGATILDARPRERYLYAHLPGALFAPTSPQLEPLVRQYVSGGDVYLIAAEDDREALVGRLEALRCEVKGYTEVADAEAYLRERGGQGIKSISFEEVDGRRHYTNVTVLDVRRPEEYAERHIEGARNVPFDALPQHLGELPRDETLIVHCKSGGRAAIAAAYLQREGFHVIHVGDAFERYRVRKPEGAAAS